MSCPICLKRPGAHSFSKIGHDGSGYTCPALATDYYDGKGIVAHFRATLLFESNWIWKIDAQGFGVKHAAEIGVAMDLISFFRESSKNIPLKIVS